MRAATPRAEPGAWDPAARWIRVLEERADGLVELEYAVGEPGLFVELVLPRAEFEAFCAAQGVTPTDGPLPAAPEGEPAHEFDWSLREARARHFRHEP